MRHAFLTTAGNSLGVLAWGCFAAVGIAAAVATSAAVFDAVKLVGAVALVLIGLRSIRSKREPETVAASGRSALRTGLLTSLANPKLAVFFVALFPQFIPRGAAMLPCALTMVGVIVALDLFWYSLLAWLVARAKQAFVAGGWGRRVERLTGAVLIGLGIRLAFEAR
jgi:threonine/homoserine/homoserine lactone efflux protein